MTRDSEALQSLQALRGVAALLVVVAHLSVVERKYANPGQQLLEGFDLGHAGVDIFFVISGVVMTLVATRAPAGPEGAWWFLFRRATRIYPVYWFYSVVVLIAQAGRPEWVNSSVLGGSSLTSSLLLLPTTENPLLAVGWTLRYEIFFYLLVAALLLGPRRALLPGLLSVLCGLVVIGALVRPEAGAPAMMTNVLLLEFGFGCVLGALHLRKQWYGGLPVALLGIAALLALETWGGGGMRSNLARVVTYGLPAVLLVYGLLSWEMRGRGRFSRGLLTLGDASYTMYLSQILVASVVGRGWHAAGLNDLLPNVIFLGVLLGACVAWTLVGHACVEKPLIVLGRSLERRRLAMRPVVDRVAKA